MSYYARPGAEGHPPQLLRDHLQAVGATAARFAGEAGLESELGRWAGLLHDLGKYSDEFQQHRLCLHADGTPNGEVPWRVEHACHGAAIAAGAAPSIAFAVAAHHSALQKLLDIENLTRPGRIEKGTLASQALPVGSRSRVFAQRAVQDGAFGGSFPNGRPVPQARDAAGRIAFELETRFLFSSLIDADRLDAEGFGDEYRAALRRDGPPLDPSARLDRVLARIREVSADSKGAPNLVDLRNRVLEHALSQAEKAPGFFSLTVPTGGGKTLTSLAWALRHAAIHGQRRIIFVIPYLSIIEQNVDVIRRAVGDDGAVLEHHSNVIDEEDGDEATGRDGQDGAALRRRLLAENWDAPIIVTTTVQFFDALFSNRPRKARRLHRIARSVVIFDEAQTFRPAFMEPICAMLQQLAAEPYRTSFLFCTATQPALTVDVGGNDGRRPRRPLIAARMTEVAPDPGDLFAELKRVEYNWPRDGETATPGGLAASMRDAGNALAVVNTKEQARVLFKALRTLDPAALHLSTRMCAAHRLEVLAEVRRRLKANEPCLLVSTQLVEAGVDLDFPAVWRAMGPLDSIAQAAGRCNREGTLDGRGHVIVFRTWDANLPGGAYRHGTGLTELILEASGGAPDMHSPDTFQDYFRRFYTVQSLDNEGIQAKRQALDFPEVAEHFKIIDQDTTPVLVRWRGGADILDRFLTHPEGAVPPAEFRLMQRYVVGLYPSELKRAEAAKLVDELPSGVRVFDGEYDEAFGLVLPGDYSED